MNAFCDRLYETMCKIQNQFVAQHLYWLIDALTCFGLNCWLTAKAKTCQNISEQMCNKLVLKFTYVL